MFLSHFRQSSQNWMQSCKHVVHAVENGLGNVFIDVNKQWLYFSFFFFFATFPARNALISTDQVVSGCFYSVDPYTSRAGKFIFHPEVLLGLSGGEKKKKWQTSSQSLGGKCVEKPLSISKTVQHLLDVFYFFLPSFTERRRRRGEQFPKGCLFS